MTEQEPTIRLALTRDEAKLIPSALRFAAIALPSEMLRGIADAIAEQLREQEVGGER